MSKLIAVIVVFLLSACATGDVVDPNKVSGFEKGKTTYSEVIKALGEPTQKTLVSGKTTLTYIGTQSNGAEYLGYIPVVGGYISGVGSSLHKGHADGYIFTFNKKLVLEDIASSTVKN